MRTATVQNIHHARQLHKAALNSESQAQGYETIAKAIQALDIADFLKADEIARLSRLADEYYEDHDELLGRIDPELIDQL